MKSANVDTEEFLTLKNPSWNCCDLSLKMLEEGVHADIKLIAKGGSVKAHKSVLACVSPVFNAMFQLTSAVDIPINMSIKALQLFLLLLYTTNKVDREDVSGSEQMTCSSAIIDMDFGDILCEAVLASKVPHLSGAIDMHFDELYKAILKYQVESRLGYVLLSGLARNLTLENCWYYFGSSMMAAPGPFKNSAGRVCFDYLLVNYRDAIKSRGLLKQMMRHPNRVQLVITRAEYPDLRKRALEDHLRIKRL